MRTYTCSGDVRGDCPHNHRKIEGAMRCLKRDRRGCKSQGGYSDRQIIAKENGKPRDLTEVEYLYSVSK